MITLGGREDLGGPLTVGSFGSSLGSSLAVVSAPWRRRLRRPDSEPLDDNDDEDALVGADVSASGPCEARNQLCDGPGCAASSTR